MENLKKIRELTERLTSWEPKEYHEGYIDIVMEKGVSKMFKLMYEPAVSVSKVFISEGAQVKTHIHHQKEFIICYKGSIKVETISYKKTLKVGDSIYLNKKEPHLAVALEDSWLIVITVPASEVFPK